MRSFRIGAILVLTILVGVVAAVAYNLGLSNGAAEAALAEGAAVIYAPATISPLGIIVGGFFLLLLLGFIARLVMGPRRHLAHGHGGHGWGPGGYARWDGENVPERFRPPLERWHREAHEATGATPPSGGPTPSGQNQPPSWRPPAGPMPPTDRPPSGA